MLQPSGIQRLLRGRNGRHALEANPLHGRMFFDLHVRSLFDIQLCDKKDQTAAGVWLTRFVAWFNRSTNLSPKNLLDLLLRRAPGRNRLFQKLASLCCQAKRLRATILVGHLFQPATSLHSFDAANEFINVDFKILADLSKLSPSHLGGVDQDVRLDHLQVERMRKPFEVLAEGLVSKNRRGDRTSWGLFLAGLRPGAGIPRA